MQKTFLFVLVLSLFVFSGCMQSLVEEATESAIENSMEGAGEDVDVDLSNGNMQFNADGVSFQGGDNSTWPTDFPSDVYKIDGEVISSMSTAEEGSYWVMVQVESTVDEAIALYKADLEAQGWTIAGSGTYSGTSSLAAEKDDRTLAVMAITTDGKTSVTITESRQ